KATAEIVGMYAKAGHPEVTSDEVPWCAAFVGACLKDAGLPNTGSLLARSYLDYGTKIEDPRVGCIAVFRRGAPPSGHVAFVTGWGAGHVRVIGGNQGDAVSEANYRESDVLGYRWPPEQLPAAVVNATKPIARSGTVWGSLAGAMAAIGAFFEQSASAVIEWGAKFAEFGPAQTALASMGGNVKSITLGLGIGSVLYVISRRVKAKQEGAAG
ncbi:MAG: hypothetical protein QG572_916, partial [Pseudomonadota bacterium]|nr:hypothetical protein [Pseudomonadota bacterium]